jgi:peptide/nickel transport system substrate-binding protein
LQYGEAAPVQAFAYNGSWAYDPTIKGYPYDTARAKQLLTEAGYASGFTTKYTYSAGADAQAMAESIAAQLKEVGITVQLNPVTTSQWQDLSFRSGSWEGFITAGPPPYPDFAAGIRDRFAGDGKNYAKMLAPDDYKAAVAAACAAPDQATKAALTKAALKLLVDKYCLMFQIYYQTRLAFFQKYVHDTGIYVMDSDSMWWPEKAWIDKK